jgi:hypothetical protein
MQCGLDGKEACGNMQLCTGLEDGIEGAIHASIQRVNNTMLFPDEGIHAAAPMGELQPLTEPRTEPPD